MQVKINDWNINYEVIGKGNPVILLHGWLANLETMRPIANNLCQNFKERKKCESAGDSHFKIFGGEIT